MSRAREQLSVWRMAFDWRDLRKSKYGLRPIILFICLTLFTGLLGRFSVVAGPNIAQDLNLDLRTVGAIAAVVGTISTVLILFFGWLADRTNRVRMSGIGTLIAGAAQMSQSAVQNTGQYATSQIGGQAGGLAVRLPNLSLLADYYPVEARGRAYASVGAVGQVTSLLSLVVVGIMVTAVGWRPTNLILSAPIFVLGIAVLLVLREPVRGYFEKRALGFNESVAEHADPPQSFGEAWRTTWSIRMVRRLFIAQIFTGIAGAPMIFLPFLLADEYGLSAGERAWYTAPGVIVILAAGFLGGGIVDALGRRSPSSVLRVIALVQFGSVLSVVMLALQPPLIVLLAMQVVTNAAQALVRPAIQSIFSQVIPAKIRSQGLTVLNLSELPQEFALGLLFAPIVGAYGFSAMWLTAIPFEVIGVLILFSLADYYEVDRRNAYLSTAADEEARRIAEDGSAPLLVCRGVNVSYESNQVLFGVDFEVQKGEIVALLGTNGAGKSTLLRAISGTQEASDGAIIADGRDITHMPPHEIVERGVVHMPGGRGVFPALSVEENLTLATWLAGADKEAALLDEAYEIFPVLKERRTQNAGLLSGGEQQMLSLAQAFIAKPKLLMIDELSLGLSPAVVGELIKQVKEINRRGTTVIVVEQSVNVALTIAERAVFMEKGEVRFVGKTAELLRRPDILRAVYVKGTSGATNGHRRTPKVSRELGEADVVLRAEGITKRFGGVTALDDVDLELRDGQIVGLIGPNGSGKTTLFDILSGYQSADSGTIHYGNTDVTAMPAHERAKLGLVRRFQDARLFPSLTVMESLLVALDPRIDSSNLALSISRLPAMRRSERMARARAERLIHILRLEAYRDKFVKELSTGLRRIVDIAWVLATEPKVLLLDEPSSGVAQAEAESFVPLLERVRTETGCAILLVEHDISVVSQLSDEIVAMASGRVIAKGSAQTVLDDPAVIEAFLGTSEAAVRRSGALT